VLAAMAAGLLAALDRATKERIAENEAQQLRLTLQAVLPPGSYDNEPRLDRISVQAADALGSSAPLSVYRARRGGEPAGLVLTAVAPDGYVDAIRLLIGISAAGEVTGVRAVQHAETPGLGDGIDTARSDWILGFDSRPVPAADEVWNLRRDGGDFDQLTGATITSRAVLNAVRRALEYYRMNRNELYALPPAVPGAADGD
jgi:electron transport complex protein RnfG